MPFLKKVQEKLRISNTTKGVYLGTPEAEGEIHYRKDKSGDYIPYANIEFPIEALKIIMIGPKCGRYAYGMVQSLLFERKIKQQVQVLNSSCPL